MKTTIINTNLKNVSKYLILIAYVDTDANNTMANALRNINFKGSEYDFLFKNKNVFIKIWDV